MGLIGSTEENDRQRAGRRGKVCRSRIGADEKVGTLQQGRRLGNREPAGQIAEPIMMRQHLVRERIFRSAHDHHAPSIVQKALNEGVPVAGRPALGRRAGTKMNRQKRRERAESSCVQSLGIQIKRLCSTGRGEESRLTGDVRSVSPTASDGNFQFSSRLAGPGRGQAAPHHGPIRIAHMDLDPRRVVGRYPQRFQQGHPVREPRGGREPSQRHP